MEIYSYICTRTHHIDDKNSFSLIYDARHNLYYFLKGISSYLWDVIVEYKNYNKIKSFALDKNLGDEFNSFLSELKERRIIKTDKNFKKTNFNFLSKPLNRKSSNVYYFLDKWKKLTTSLGLIDTLILELNYKCNLKCKHCFNHKDMEKYSITFAEAKKAIDEAYDLGILCVRLTGGECTLNKDFLKICEYIRSKRLELCIYTNGQIFNDNKELLNKVIELYPTRIQFSIYSMEENIHDYITGVKGSLQKTLNVIQKLKETSIFIDIATPVLSYNKDCYKEVQKYATSIGVEYRDNCVFTNNPENSNLNSKLSYKEIKQFYIDKFGVNQIKPRFFKDEYSICEAGYDRLCITPKLDVIPCVAFEYILGNLNSTTLEKIKETTLEDFKKIFIRKNLTECFNEEYCSYCHYCPDSSVFEKNFMKKHPILCENAKAYYNALVCPENEK
ncbi:MAG: radical SAM protein [Candidatus Gastranaerophilales bacterium]|nr:radical SAM protein [Candidatus Gastranaerophilales bacterium]